MPFEKVFEPNVDFTPLREMHNDFLDFSIDSNTLKVLNRDAYRMFVGKLIEFNNKYAPKIDRNIRENEEAYKQNRFVNTKYVSGEELFTLSFNASPLTTICIFK